MVGFHPYYSLNDPAFALYDRSRQLIVRVLCDRSLSDWAGFRMKLGDPVSPLIDAT